MAADERPDEQVHRQAGEDERRQYEQAADDGGRGTQPDEGCGGRAGQRHPVAVGEPVPFRPEDVGVVEVNRVRPQLVRDPADTPDREQRVPEVGHHLEIPRVRIEHHDGQHDHQPQHAQQLDPDRAERAPVAVEGPAEPATRPGDHPAGRVPEAPREIRARNRRMTSQSDDRSQQDQADG
jgi:hypothetical protein